MSEAVDPPSAPSEDSDEERAWAEAMRRNREIAAERWHETRFAVAVQDEDGRWGVEIRENERRGFWSRVLHAITSPLS
jgi:hypothetical protein